MTTGAAIEHRSGEYHPVGDELDLVLGAWRAQLPVLLKGPTGCGKPRPRRRRVAVVAPRWPAMHRPGC